MSYIKKHPEYALLFLFSVIGILTATSYGFAWDEYAQRDIGIICYDYIFHNNQYYLAFQDRDHGALFEFVLVCIEKACHINTTKSLYMMRHFCTNLFFLISAVYFYKLILQLYKNKTLALIGFLLLVINPTIYGHSFFNSKDIPFLSMIIICFYQFVLAFRDKKYYQFILLALFSAFLMNIRIMGVLFVVFVLFFLLFDLITFIKEKGAMKKHMVLIVLYTLASIIFLIIFWPLLWKDPLDNFLFVFKSLSNYGWDGTMLFKGKFISGHDITWDYLPTWFCINTPIIYLLLGCCGLIAFAVNSFKLLKHFNLKKIDRNNFLFALSFLAPILAIIILKSVVYDTWRHVFYIYPAFILLAIYFINILLNTTYKKAALLIPGVAIFFAGLFIILNFPFHHVYFNQFVSLHKNEYIRKNYEMDYWGVSYNQSLKYILKTDKRIGIMVTGENGPHWSNSFMLTEAEKKRLIFVDSIPKADYYLTNYRWHPQDYDTAQFQEIKSFVVLGNKINTVFKVKK